jgi:hypothetical protein
MISIQDLISIQSPSDVNAFIAHLEARNKRRDTRNTTLFRAFLKGEEQSILDEIGSNAFNALKKRLTDQLIEYSGGQLLAKELSQENQVIKLIALARKLFNAKREKTGYALLKRAEKMALTLNHYALLNEIYHTLIEHSHKIDQLEQKDLFSKLEQNNAQFLAEERLSILYASMQKQFNTSNYGVFPSSLKAMYKEGLKTYGIKPDLALNFRSLYQLAMLSDLYATQTKNYHGLDLFFEDNIIRLQGGEKDTEKMLGYHIALLYGMSTIYFRRTDLAKSSFYLDQMSAQMQRYQNKHLSLWEARYANLLALNLNYSGNYSEAVLSLERCLKQEALNEQERPLLELTLSMVYFQQGNHKEVKKLLGSFYKSDQWYLKTMGNEWLFNFKAMEVLLHFDLGNDQLAESRILSFQRKFALHFKEDKSNPLWPFLMLLKSVLYDPEHISSPEFVQKLELTIPWKGEEEDFFNRCFYAWLKAKILKQPIYETTLSLLGFNPSST